MRSGSDLLGRHDPLSAAVRSRLVRRIAVGAVVIAVLAGTWYGLAAALLPEPPAPREILLGAGAAFLAMFPVISGLAVIETRTLRREEQRMRRFLADASHELRTPIAAVQANAETLLRTAAHKADQEKLVLRILHEAHRAGRLIDDLLTITRLEQRIPLRRDEFDLVALAAAAVEGTSELAPSLDVRLDAPPQCPVRGDAGSIRLLLDNLLSNARHATPAGGRITVRISFASSETLVEVLDSGPGIRRADRERIFHRFTRLADGPAHPDGSGLGLAIARSIAHAHAGTLSCSEPEGGGARFVLRLPACRSAERHDHAGRTRDSGVNQPI
jgi:signal transduction histidine kinase